ncbi:MAG: SdpI family protein [Ruminococcaceae bacterium]|nr:SdpI family protein [Oscillospiraceae bacterium]
MEALKELGDLDLGALIPQLDTLMGWVELLLRLCVMAAPLLLLGFGLVFLLAPPKEANYGLGYRFWWGMSSLQAWQFTQRLAGMVWSGLGAVLTILMALLCTGLRDMEPMDMAQQAGIYVLWELGLTAVACIAIDVIVIVRFDSKGYLRSENEEEYDEEE